MMEFLTAQNILTGLLVIITAIYAFLTHRISKANQAAVRAMQEQSEALTRPYVLISLYLSPRDDVFYLRIQNTGKTSANNLRLKLDRDFFCYGNVQPSNNLASFNAFNLPIATFSPGVELLFELCRGVSMYDDTLNEEVTPKTFTVTATYSYAGGKISEDTEIDLKPFRQSTVPREDNSDRLVRKLEDIRKELEKNQSSGPPWSKG